MLSFTLLPTGSMALNYNTTSFDEYVVESEVEETESEIGLNRLRPIIVTLGKALYRIVGGIPYTTNNTGYVDQWTDGRILVNHGAVDFNAGNTHARVRKEVEAYGQDEVRLYGTANQISHGRMTIYFKDSNLNIIDWDNVGSNDYFDYTVPGPRDVKRTYYVDYVVSNPERWTPKMWYYDTSNWCPDCIIAEDPDDVLEYDNAVIKDGKMYIKQGSSSNTLNEGSELTKDTFTMDDLFIEFYDEKIGELTDQTKTLSPGDKVIFKDKILKLDYNAEQDYTLLGFHSNITDFDYHTITFKGDLTKNYKIGDFLDLEFNIEKTAEINGDIFVDYNYNIEFSQSNETPEINNYLRD